ncbi:hypothetical protein Bca101_020432 [Brassica carinata]
MQGIRVFNSALDASFKEARISRFKDDLYEKKLLHFQNDVAELDRDLAEVHSQAIRRAERRGRRMVAAELASRASLFRAEFEKFKEAQDFVGDFRECSGSVGTLSKTQDAGHSFLSEIDEMSGHMNECAQAESMVPQIEGRIQKLWDPIAVSEDTAEAGANVADEEGDLDLDL